MKKNQSNPDIILQGGVYRGKTLSFPKGLLRPTSMLLKRRIFDRYQDLSTDPCYFFDLFAGSGSMGLEAFSRGAEKVFFFENDRQVERHLARNIQSFSSENLVLQRASAPDALKKMLTQTSHQILHAKRIIFFLDPPYEQEELYWQCLEVIKQEVMNGIMAEIWIESCKQKGCAPEKWGERGLKLEKIYWQGSKYIAIAHF